MMTFIIEENLDVPNMREDGDNEHRNKMNNLVLPRSAASRLQYAPFHDQLCKK
jgi:hypothetical protein